MPDMLSKLRLVSVMMVISLAACTNLPENPSHPRTAGWSAPLIVTSQVEEMMVYYDFLRKQTPAELTKEYDKARQNLVQAKTDVNRMRVAMLLAMPNTPFHDSAAASSLLNEVGKDAKTSPGMRGLVSMMTMLISEQQRANNIADVLSQKLKDEQKRADTLQTQVDGIKNMEKNLIRRDRRGINAKP
ncbi:MAG: dihydrolipoamide acyltransferase [Pseudomonadota bacterium]